nr:hypothetical protein Iba_chr14dCG1180 [Ipomoea batatas]
MEIGSPKIVVFLVLIIFVAGFPSMEVEALPNKPCKTTADCKNSCDVGSVKCVEGVCVCFADDKKSFDNVILQA